MGTKDDILGRINAKAGGNSHRGLKEVCSDIIAASGLKDSQVADLALISASTVARLRELTPAESGQPYRPQAESIERVLRGLGIGFNMTPERITKKYQNQPKVEE